LPTAKAMLLVEPQRFTATTFVLPPVETGGWLAIEATGISGSDVQVWQGTNRYIRYPLIPGHEIVGRVASVIDGSFDIPIGTRVLVESSIRCGACRRCLAHLHSCSFRKPINAYGRLPSTEPPGLWGGFAEYLYLDPGTRLHPVTDDVQAPVATFGHALADAFTWTVEGPGLRAEDSVLILGPGPRGLAAVIAAREAGAGWIGVSGLTEDRDRLDLARELGADMVVDARKADVAGSVADSLGARPEIVLDVTRDDPDAIHTALDLVRAGGTVVVASLKGVRAVNQLFSDIVVLKEITVRGGLGASSTGYHWAARYLETDPRLDDLVSHEFPLDEAERAIEAAAGLLGHDELISVAVTF
jgi:threonine dehydrogenase-like Zn-dependent dehydrogenase